MWVDFYISEIIRILKRINPRSLTTESKEILKQNLVSALVIMTYICLPDSQIVKLIKFILTSFHRLVKRPLTRRQEEKIKEIYRNFLLFERIHYLTDTSKGFSIEITPSSIGINYEIKNVTQHDSSLTRYD